MRDDGTGELLAFVLLPALLLLKVVAVVAVWVACRVLDAVGFLVPRAIRAGRNIRRGYLEERRGRE